jgi:hypothetical protein
MVAGDQFREATGVVVLTLRSEDKRCMPAEKLWRQFERIKRERIIAAIDETMKRR